MASKFFVQWYEYAGQGSRWRAFWYDLARFLPLNSAPTFGSKNETPAIWQEGTYTLTWACGGDIALAPGRFRPFAIPLMARHDGTYISRILARPGVDLSHACVGINQATSHSGHLALARWWYGQGLKQPKVQLTGSHENSVLALLKAEIDLISVDGQGYDLLLQAYPDLMKMVQLGQTDAQLAPPFCLPGLLFGSQDISLWQTGLKQFTTTCSNKALALGIQGFRFVEEADYIPLGQTLQRQLAAGQILTPI